MSWVYFWREKGLHHGFFLFSIYFTAANEALIASFQALISLIFKTEKDCIFTISKVTKVITSATAIDFLLDELLYADDKTKWSDLILVKTCT